MSTRLEIVCPAGTPAALEAAVAAGADAVYFGFRDETNARNFPGLNFSPEEAGDAVRRCHDAGVKALIAVNTYVRAGNPEPWQRAVARAVEIGADAVILADLGLAIWAHRQFPQQRLHLSVQASAANPLAIEYFAARTGVRRVVLPRVLTIERIRELTAAVTVETEVFVFGGLCVMAEGRCILSSYVTGRSPNMNGVCSPAEQVRYERDGEVLTTRLATITVNRVSRDEPAGYPTLCKGRYVACGRPSYLFEEPASLSALTMLRELRQAGVTAIKIEGRQRGRAYVARVVGAIRRAVDALARGEELPEEELAALMEGGRSTAGAYDRRWR